MGRKGIVAKHVAHLAGNLRAVAKIRLMDITASIEQLHVEISGLTKQNLQKSIRIGW